MQFDRTSRIVAKTIGTIAPNMALKYLSRRAWLAYYTGASPSGPNQRWRPTEQSADAILRRDRTRLLARARDLERNSSHISGAIGKIVNNVIYTGIKPQARIRDAEGKLKKSLNDLVETRWKEWAEHEDINFYDIQELILRHLWIDGEVLIHKFYDPDLQRAGVCPLNLEVLEADFIDSSRNANEENGNVTKSGIEYNRNGKPVAYHLFKTHPGDSSTTSYYTTDTRRVPATEIKHIFHKRRASQSRGVSWLAAVIIEMKDFDEYQSSERTAARLASAFGVFVQSPYPEHQLNNPLLSENSENAELFPSLDEVPEHLGTGRIDTLPPGMEIKAAQFQRPGQTYEPFTKTSLKGASTGTGLSYENFSNDFSEATYSAARQAVLEERRGYRKMQMFLNRHLNNWVSRAWLEYGSMVNLLGGIGIDVPINWQNPGWPWIDPQKDSKAAEIELDMKSKSRTTIAAERGDDWQEEIEKIQNEEEILREDDDAAAETGAE